MRALGAARAAAATGDGTSLTADDAQNMLAWNMNIYLPALAGVLILGIGDSMVSGSCVGHARLSSFLPPFALRFPPPFFCPIVKHPC